MLCGLLTASFSIKFSEAALMSLGLVLVGEEVLGSRQARGLVGEGCGEDMVVIGYSGVIVKRV